MTPKRPLRKRSGLANLLLAGGQRPPESGVHPEGVALRPRTGLSHRTFHSRALVVLLQVRHQRFGREKQSGDAGSVTEGGADDLYRVDDPSLVHIHVLTGVGVVSSAEGLA